MRCENCRAEISEAKILSAAGRIHSRMQKQRRGGRPLNVYDCRFCKAPCIGRVNLAQHEAACGTAPSREVIPEDMAAIAWEPENAG